MAGELEESEYVSESVSKVRVSSSRLLSAQGNSASRMLETLEAGEFMAVRSRK